MPSLPVRGPAVRDLGLPLPPARMRLLRRGRPLKRWRYIGVYGPELMLCAGEARVGGLPQRWWAVALPDGRLVERTSSRRIGLNLSTGRVLAAGRDLSIDLELDEADGVEVVSEDGGAYIWTRKQAGVPVRGRVAALGGVWDFDGPLAFVDDSAGYHARHTRWRWSAGLGRAAGGLPVAWNLVEGIHDAPEASERTVWVAGEPREVAPVAFDGLRAVGGLRFEPVAVRAARENYLVVRSDYEQPFGTFTGSLPGAGELREGWGVMERHNVLW
jgi:hypothetical protein